MTELLFKISNASYTAAGIFFVFSIFSFIRLKNFKDRPEFGEDDRIKMLEDIMIVHTEEYIDSCSKQGRCISNAKNKKDNYRIFENNACGSNYNDASCHTIRSNKSRG